MSLPKSFQDELNILNNRNLNTNGVRDVTLQVTNDCCCNCSYCYQTNKGKLYMSKQTAKQIIDLLFNMNLNETNNIINQDTFGIILDFIGGEPLMNLEVIDYSCSYFLEECLKRNHHWARHWKCSFVSNGALFFKNSTQDFLKKFKGFISFGITLDGPKQVHDSCRKYFDGTGNFKDAYKAFKYCQKNFGYNQTKVTISKNILNNIDEIIQFFIEEDVTQINMNPIYEYQWDTNDGKIYYNGLKKICDIILNNHKNISISTFVESIGYPLKENELQTYCGGTGLMLAFDPQGNAYPCIRYMDSSLNGMQPPLIIGNCFEGICNTPETRKIYNDLKAITRRTQSTDKCFYCPIASGCSYCSAYNYQCFGTANSRSTNICNMHKARVLANVYYWNLYYEKNNINKVFEMNLPKDDALNFIDEKEYNMLLDLVNSRKEKIKTL